MSIRCDEDAGLTLSSTFGHMQLVGFRNPELGLQQVFANIEIMYTATNVGLLDLDLTGAFGSSLFAGFQDFLGGNVVELSRGQSQSFAERLTLNLEAAAGIPFTFTLLTQGKGSVSQIDCEATDAFTLLVQ